MYDGKSERAKAAELEGKLAASALGKVLGVSAAVVKATLRPVEWHHTSGFFNKTDYYEEPLLVAVARGETTGYDDDEIVEARAILEGMRAADRQRRAVESETFVARRVVWLEWSGTRKRPKATSREAENVYVTIKGAWAVVELPSGPMRKRLDCNGFEIERG